MIQGTRSGGGTRLDWTDWNWTDQTDQTDWNCRPTRTRPTRPTGPDQTRVTSAEQRLPIKDQGSWIMNQGSWIKDQRSSIKERIKDAGSWIKDLGPCFGMNDHPTRDTGVISRLSKCTIEDLSVYIGFVTSRILDLGLA